MYLVVGAHFNRHWVLATTGSATNALGFYLAKVGIFDLTYVVSPDGVKLDEIDLAQHALAEQQAVSMIEQARTLH